MPKSKRRKRSKSKTGYIGVVKRSSERYGAQIGVDGTMKNLGSYDTAKQAAEVYDKEAIKSRRPFSKLNFPKKAPVGYSPIQQALRATNTVGYRGVQKRGKKFRAWKKTSVIGGKSTAIGTFETAKEAAIAYDRAVLKANHSTTLLNFPDMVHNLDVEPKRTNIKRSVSGYRGVAKNGKGFTARIYTNGKSRVIGTFDTAIQAALAYDQAAIKKGNKKSTLNFPMDQKDQKKQKKREKQTKQTKQTKQKKTKKKDLLTIQEYKEMLYGDME